jgi:hypothetical protein
MMQCTSNICHPNRLERIMIFWNCCASKENSSNARASFTSRSSIISPDCSILIGCLFYVPKWTNQNYVGGSNLYLRTCFLCPTGRCAFMPCAVMFASRIINERNRSFELPNRIKIPLCHNFQVYEQARATVEYQRGVMRRGTMMK